MGATPCGCDLAERAEKIADERARAVLLKDARNAQKRWRCPLAGHDGGALDVECRRTCVTVERVLGCVDAARADRDEPTELHRCPGSYTRTRDAGVVADLYSWWLRSQLAVVWPYPPGTVTDAISALHQGVEAAKADAMRRLREEHEREQKKGRR